MRSLKVQSCIVSSEGCHVGFRLTQRYCGHPQMGSSVPCDFSLSPELHYGIFSGFMEKIEVVVCWWPGFWPFFEVLQQTFAESDFERGEVAISCQLVSISLSVQQDVELVCHLATTWWNVVFKSRFYLVELTSDVVFCLIDIQGCHVFVRLLARADCQVCR